MDTGTVVIHYKPIGIIHSPFKKTGGMPIQASKAEDAIGTVIIDANYREGLSDLEGFSHLILIYHFHKVEGFDLKVVPFLDTKTRGLFSTRAPKRPNPIGLSTVKLLSLKETTLTVQNIDVLDKTPLLDIKPFVEQFDRRDNVRSGWLESAMNQEKLSDNRFR